MILHPGRREQQFFQLNCHSFYPRFFGVFFLLLRRLYCSFAIFQDLTSADRVQTCLNGLLPHQNAKGHQSGIAILCGQSVPREKLGDARHSTFPYDTSCMISAAMHCNFGKPVFAIISRAFASFLI